MITFFLLVCVLTIVRSDPVAFSDCGSKYNLEDVDIEGCSGVNCDLKMNSYTRVSVKMSAGHQSKRALQKITIIVHKIHTDTHSSPGPCTPERPCPISTGDASFTTQLWVPDIAPFSSTLEWKIFDETGNNMLLCFYTYANLHY